jgi:hypothetical protein
MGATDCENLVANLQLKHGAATRQIYLPGPGALDRN